MRRAVAERLLEVIHSGRRIATYKLAVLMAVLDLCARHGIEPYQAQRIAVELPHLAEHPGLLDPPVIRPSSTVT